MSKSQKPEENQKLKVVFIGLGKMGSGMARNIQQAGFPLLVYNRSSSKTEPFVDAGASAASTPKEAAASADILVTSLLDDRSILDMMTADDGILAGLPEDGIHLSTTTISPAASSQLSELHQEHGSHYVATNVLGRPTAAAEGYLDALVAGDPAIIERCRPVLETFTNSVTNMGEHPSAAARMKLIINFFLSGLVENMGEAYVFAEKYGFNLETVRDLMLYQVLPNPALKEYAERIRQRDFDNAGATLSTSIKDLNLILSEAGAVGLPLPIADLVRGHILTGLARGQGDLDWSIATQANRRAGGLE